MHAGGYRFLLTRDLEAAESYLRERYIDAGSRRHGRVRAAG